MVELKFYDVESVNAVVCALNRNGYIYSTFIVWSKDIPVKIDCYIVRIEVKEIGK